MSDDLKPLHWILGNDECELFALDFCRSCAEKRIKQYERADPEGEFILDGGWSGIECDSPPICEDCGCELQYAPTNYCLEQYPESAAYA